MASQIFKVCPQCKTLNGDVTHCENCGELLDLSQKRALIRDEKLAQKAKSSQVENKPDFVEKLKNHKYWLIRWLFRIFYSVWVLGLGIAFVFGMIVLYAAA